MSRRLSLPELARRYLAKEPHALEPEERNALKSFEERRPISRDAADIEEAQASFGDRLADQVAAVGGSWGFIIVFMAVLLGWMLVNSGLPERLHFDPYPYIFLNLMLSMLAAIQAPIIMMSQNRQGDRDRVAASHDYEVNLRAEIEIMRLHEKLDALIARLDAKEADPLV
jgi:uncharacterized membrane protein